MICPGLFRKINTGYLNIYFFRLLSKINKKAGFELKVEKNYNESPLQFASLQI